VSSSAIGNRAIAAAAAAAAAAFSCFFVQAIVIGKVRS
jgi:hypothetical protein